MAVNKPFLNYNGGKESAGTFQSIINQIPPHDILIIPFAGNCAITRKIKPCRLTILIDKDIKVIRAWKKCNPSFKLITPEKNIFNDYDFNFINLFAHSGYYIIHADAISLLKNIYATDIKRFNLNIVVYADPPYLKETRLTNKNLYKHELFEPDHVELLKLFLSITGITGDRSGKILSLNPTMQDHPKIKIMISAYENDLYNSMLNTWNKIYYYSKLRTGKKVKETLYLNFKNDSGILHDYNYLGKDFRERERIKRKISRHVNRLKRLNNFEKNAIIEKIKESF